MKRSLLMIFCTFILFFCFEYDAYANIAPLKINADGVEPIMNPGVMIEAADITVSPDPDNNLFKFNSNYTLKGLKDTDNLIIGIPGDLGYTLEAGYIEDMNVIINGRPIKYKAYTTTKQLPETWKNYNSQLNFKWHTFPISVKKDALVKISLSYTTSWRILEQNKSSPYHIVPFLLSTEKLFGSSIGSYRIKYINDDYISLPDAKVLINSILEPNIISNAILSPKWSDSEITWEFKNPADFQDFRLVVLSFKKLSMEFSKSMSIEGTEVENSIKWATLNNNFERLAEIYENIAKRNTKTSLESSDLGTAAYLSSEFYFRQKNYNKALEMLSLPYKTSLWPASIKMQYINSFVLNELNRYDLLLEELKKLIHYKDYILVSNYAESRIGPATEMLIKEQAKKQAEQPPEPEEKPVEEPKEKPEEKPSETGQKGQDYLKYLVPVVILILLFALYKKIREK